MEEMFAQERVRLMIFSKISDQDQATVVKLFVLNQCTIMEPIERQIPEPFVDVVDQAFEDFEEVTMMMFDYCFLRHLFVHWYSYQ